MGFFRSIFGRRKKVLQCWKCGVSITKDVSKSTGSLCLSCLDKRSTQSSRQAARVSPAPSIVRERPSKHNYPSVDISSVIRDLHSESPLERRKAALTLKSIGRPAEAAAGRELFNMVKREALRDDSDQLAYNYGVEALDALGINRPF